VILLQLSVGYGDIDAYLRGILMLVYLFIIAFEEPRARVGSQQHTFAQHKYLRPSKCDHCTENLWGVQVRCQGKMI
jgi:hypothetical protein